MNSARLDAAAAALDSLNRRFDAWSEEARAAAAEARRNKSKGGSKSEPSAARGGGAKASHPNGNPQSYKHRGRTYEVPPDAKSQAELKSMMEDVVKSNLDTEKLKAFNREHLKRYPHTASQYEPRGPDRHTLPVHRQHGAPNPRGERGMTNLARLDAAHAALDTLHQRMDAAGICDCGGRMDAHEVRTDPPVSEKQRRAMRAAAAGNSNLGISKAVGKEFSEADPGGKLPETKADATGYVVRRGAGAQLIEGSGRDGGKWFVKPDPNSSRVVTYNSRDKAEKHFEDLQ